MKTLAELMNEIGRILPGATVGEDLDGQLVIYTDRKVDADENLITFDAEE